MGISEIRYSSRMKSRIERMMRVQRVKLTGPGFSSMSPERKRKARRKGQREQRVCGRVNRVTERGWSVGDV